MFTKLNNTQIEKKLNFIENYKRQWNAATASKMDANANVDKKNIATLEAEINKDINVQINRAVIGAKINTMFGEDIEAEYKDRLKAMKYMYMMRLHWSLIVYQWICILCLLVEWRR